MSSIDTGQKLRDAFRATFGDPSANAQSAMDNVAEGFLTVKYEVHKFALDSNTYLINGAVVTNAAAVAYTMTLDHNVQVQFAATQLALTFQNAITEVNTNLATFQLVYNNGAGGTDTVLFTGNTAVGGGIGNCTAEQPKALTINTSNNPVTRLSCLQLKVTKGGAGLILPPFSATVKGRIV